MPDENRNVLTDTTTTSLLFYFSMSCFSTANLKLPADGFGKESDICRRCCWSFLRDITVTRVREIERGWHKGG